MARASDMTKAIQPGSTEYGDRQKLAAGIMSTMGAGGGGGMPGGGPGGMMPEPVPSPMEPIGAMLGEYGPEDFGDPNEPLTAGLSHGPGVGPAGEVIPPISDLHSKLLAVAQYAKTPHLRMQARMALRRLVRNERSGYAQ